MKIKEPLICPKCSGSYFQVKREATYLYTYKLNTPNTEEWSENEEALPFLFDNREKISDNDYLECEQCKEKYPCDLDSKNSKVHFTILQKAIRADYKTNPNFLG